MKNVSRIAWGLCGLIILVSLFNASRDILYAGLNGDSLKLLDLFLSGIIPIVFALVGALILSQQPRNVIGWLVMTPSILLMIDGILKSLIQNITIPATAPPISLILVLWFVGADWVGFIFPLFFIALLFPTGSPASPRWRWVVGYGIALLAFFLAVSFFVQTIMLDPETYGVNLAIRNPVGFIPNSVIDAIFSTGWWGLALAILTVLSAVSLVMRYRGAAAVEREQIKWILYASGLFSLIYAPLLSTQDNLQGVLGALLNILLIVGVLGFPVAIGIAILRYRLYDIDIIIRKTLVYGALTITLALVYFGSVLLLQGLFQTLTGQSQSQVVTVISTLAIAALFTPLRRRIQNDIDRRFYRKKYDAEKALEGFAATVRQQVDLDEISDSLLRVVQETMQPEETSLWLIRNSGTLPRRPDDRQEIEWQDA